MITKAVCSPCHITTDDKLNKLQVGRQYARKSDFRIKI